VINSRTNYSETYNIVGFPSRARHQRRTFVFAWLGGITFLVAFFVILVFYIIPFLYFRH